MLNNWKPIKCVKCNCKSTNTATCKAAKRQQQQQKDSCSGVGNKIASFEESSHRFSQSFFFGGAFSFSGSLEDNVQRCSHYRCRCVRVSRSPAAAFCACVCCFWRERFLAAANGLRSMSQASHWTTATITRRGGHGELIGWITKPATTKKNCFYSKSNVKKYEKY